MSCSSFKANSVATAEHVMQIFRDRVTYSTYFIKRNQKYITSYPLIVTHSLLSAKLSKEKENKKHKEERRTTKTRTEGEKTASLKAILTP